MTLLNAKILGLLLFVALFSLSCGKPQAADDPSLQGDGSAWSSEGEDDGGVGQMRDLVDTLKNTEGDDGQMILSGDLASQMLGNLDGWHNYLLDLKRFDDNVTDAQIDAWLKRLDKIEKDTAEIAKRLAQSNQAAAKPIAKLYSVQQNTRYLIQMVDPQGRYIYARADADAARIRQIQKAKPTQPRSLVARVWKGKGLFSDGKPAVPEIQLIRCPRKVGSEPVYEIKAAASCGSTPTILLGWMRKQKTDDDLIGLDLYYAAKPKQNYRLWAGDQKTLKGFTFKGLLGYTPP